MKGVGKSMLDGIINRRENDRKSPPKPKAMREQFEKETGKSSYTNFIMYIEWLEAKNEKLEEERAEVIEILKRNLIILEIEMTAERREDGNIKTQLRNDVTIIRELINNDLNQSNT